jgi:hypothetical protein
LRTELFDGAPEGIIYFAYGIDLQSLGIIFLEHGNRFLGFGKGFFLEVFHPHSFMRITLRGELQPSYPSLKFLRPALTFLPLTSSFLRPAIAFLLLTFPFLRPAIAFLLLTSPFLRSAIAFLSLTSPFLRPAIAFLPLTSSFLRPALMHSCFFWKMNIICQENPGRCSFCLHHVGPRFHFTLVLIL